MSEPKEPTREEMLEAMDGQIMGWEIIVKTDSRTLKSGKRPDEFLSILYAIRRLIEKHEELEKKVKNWKERAKPLLKYQGKDHAKEGDTYLSFISDVGPIIKLLEEIRDLGKETAGE